MKYLDLVELINDRPEYEKAGVKKGMFGAVMSEESTDGNGRLFFLNFIQEKILQIYLCAKKTYKFTNLFRWISTRPKIKI